MSSEKQLISLLRLPILCQLGMHGRSKDWSSYMLDRQFNRMTFNRHSVKYKIEISSPFLTSTSKSLWNPLNLNSSYHPEIKGPTAKLNQILDIMLEVCVFKFQGKQENNLSLVGLRATIVISPPLKQPYLRPHMATNAKLIVQE